MRKLNTNTRVENRRPRRDYVSEYRAILREWGANWGETLSSKTWGGDLVAGLTVAAVALPLNLALAVASGLPASAGLLAGAVGGSVAAIFGGSRWQVSGPAAALNAMVFLLVKDFGAPGAAAAALVCGAVALLLGLLLAGRLSRFVPETVLTGFTTGVGIKLLDNQIPEFLGFDYTVGQLASMAHRPEWLHEVSWSAVVCGLFVALLMVATQQWKRFPAALVGVFIVTALSTYLKWDIQRVGEIPTALPLPKIPEITSERWVELIIRALPLGLLGAVESLLSAQVIDRMAKARSSHHSNLELFGQGLANLASGFLGGMPVTGVVVRSTVNLQSGGKTRLSALTHGLILLLSILYLGKALALIPLAGLAGLLCVIALRLIQLREFIHLIKSNRTHAIAFAVTLLGTVTNRLVLGLGAGLLICAIEWLLTRRRRDEAARRAEQKTRGIRAVLGGEQARARHPSAQVHAAAGSHGKHDAASPAQWFRHVRENAHVARSAFIHHEASVIGRVVLGDNVHVAADTSIRADEGTPFFIGANSNVQDGVVIHALKEKHVAVAGERWAVYVGQNVSMAHQALVHGPCYIGDNSFIGFKAVVHDSVIGSNCYVGIGAVVVGVEVPDGRFVPHGAIVDSADKASALPNVTEAHLEFNEDVVEVNRGLAAAYREKHFPVAKGALGRSPQNASSAIWRNGAPFTFARF